ncbi:MAG: hypothetical protein U0359_41360, partial [Byssovorax sp.]
CVVPGPGVALPAVAPCPEGATRACYADLPAQGAILNCYYGEETCKDGVWGPCMNGAIESSASAPGAGEAGEGPPAVPQSLSQPAPCIDDPCNPSCQRYDEIPLGGVILPGQAIPPWNSGSMASISSLPGFSTRAQRTPCGSAADCQVNAQCSLPITNGSVHDKCAPGVALADTAGADACVDAICARYPTCCATPSGSCAHNRCATGAPLTIGCDLCVGQICAARPSCCAPGGAWDSTCVDLVGTSCGLSCNQWSPFCVAQVHDTCGAFCAALPAEGPPAGCAHDKCYTGSALSAGCADGCVASICASAPFAYCCASGGVWDQGCVNAVNTVCGQTCPLKGQCVPWLGAQTDPFCPDSPDLTLGVPCGSKIPVCNVGGVTAHGPIEVLSAPAGAMSMPGCAPSPLAQACPPLQGDVAPGQCVELDCPGLATGAGEELMVNAHGAITECLSTPGTSACNAANGNNFTLSGGPSVCEPPICTGSQQPFQIKSPNLHFLIERSSASALPGGKWAGIIQGVGNFLASAGAAGTRAAVQLFPDGPPAIPWSCDAGTCFWGATPAAPYGPTGNCAVRSFPNFGLQNLPSAVFSANVKAVPAALGFAPTPMAYAAAVNIAKGYGGDRNIVLVLASDITTCNAQIFTSVSSLAGQAAIALVNSKIKTWVITVGLVSPLFDPIARSGGTGAAIAVPVGDDAALTAALLGIKANYFGCSFTLPPLALFDPHNPKVELKNAVGAVVQTFIQVPSAASCGPGSTGHFYYDDALAPTKVILCPATCSAVRQDIGYAVKLTLSCPGTYTDGEHSETYAGACPLDTRVSWGFLTYDSSEPPGTSTTFRVRAAPTIDELAAAPIHPLITASIGPPDTQSCQVGGPAPCPIDLYAGLGGPPEARHEQLELLLSMKTNTPHSKTPTVHRWQITYACLDDE